MGRKGSRKCTRMIQSDATVSDNVSDLQPSTDDIIRDIDDSFSHRYDYCIDSLWQLPSAAGLFREDISTWQDNELMSMKSRLNDVKGRLSHFDIVTWQNHTQVCCHLARAASSTKLNIALVSVWPFGHIVLHSYLAIRPYDAGLAVV